MKTKLIRYLGLVLLGLALSATQAAAQLQWSPLSHMTPDKIPPSPSILRGWSWNFTGLTSMVVLLSGTAWAKQMEAR